MCVRKSYVKYSWYPSPGVKVEARGFDVSSYALAMLSDAETPINIQGFPEVDFKFTSMTSGPLNQGRVSKLQSIENKESYTELEGVIEELRTPNSDSAHYLDFHIIDGASFNFGKEGKAHIELSKEWLIRIEPHPSDRAFDTTLKEPSHVTKPRAEAMPSMRAPHARTRAR